MCVYVFNTLGFITGYDLYCKVTNLLLCDLNENRRDIEETPTRKHRIHNL